MCRTSNPGLEEFLRRLLASPGWSCCLELVAVRPAREARFAPLPAWLPGRWRDALARRGMARLYRHQALALDLARQGRHLVLATGTASGKSLCFHLPALLAAEAGGTALLLYPTKALARDQLAALTSLAREAGCGARPVAVDGDAAPAERAGALRAPILVTNPDFLHHRLLPQHRRLAGFLARLRLVVLDEAHVYEGIFGHRAAGLLRRLRRVCRHHGAAPTFTAASATSASPAEHAAALVGVPFAPVTEDGSPRGRLALFLATARAGRARLRRRWRRLSLTAEALAAATAAGIRTVAFTPSRREAELVLALAGERLERAGKAHLLTGYRAGYLPPTRRLLEAGLARGAFNSVVATSALELGVDLGLFQLCLLCGLPPSPASLRQRLGRVGRRSQNAAAIAIVEEDEAARARSWLLEAALEGDMGAPGGAEPACRSLLPDPFHPAVVADHLLAAAAELPLKPSELPPAARREAARLLVRGLLRRGPEGLEPARRGPLPPLRAGSAPDLTARLAGPGAPRPLATAEADRALLELPPGGIHLHLGVPYLVEEAGGRLENGGGPETGGPAWAQAPGRWWAGTGARPRQVSRCWPVAVASPPEPDPLVATATVRLGPHPVGAPGRDPILVSIRVAAGRLALRRAGATILLADGEGTRRGWASAPGQAGVLPMPGLWLEFQFDPAPPLPPAALGAALARMARALRWAAQEVLSLPADAWRTDAQCPCPRTGRHRVFLLTPGAARAPFLLMEARPAVAAALARRLARCSPRCSLAPPDPCPTCAFLGAVIALIAG